MKRRFGLVVTMLTMMALLVGVIGVAAVEASKKKGSEGCTPGYWKNHTESWVGYTSGQTFQSAFGSGAFGTTKTLLVVLSQPASTGGMNALNNLGRHAVAALLNTAHPGVDTHYTEPGTVIGEFNAAYAAGPAAMEAQKNIFAGFNELGCPLN